MPTHYLFTPFQMGELTLANRMVMAPMTRNRADDLGLVTPTMVDYYQQRASAGLIVTESTVVSPLAVGYPRTPGIHTEAQAASWLRLTNAVHSAGGRVFAQLQHCGRISHPSLQPDGATPVAPTAIRPEGHAATYAGLQDFVTPRALDTAEIPALVTQFHQAAAMAVRAGFDGVEVHGGNGYLIDEFLRDGTNHRTDAYGGSAHNRMRLLNEVLDAVIDVWPPDRVGVRLTPENGFNSMSDSDPDGHFRYFAGELAGRGLAYVHVVEGDMIIKKRGDVDYRGVKSAFMGPYIANNAYDLERAGLAVAGGDADLVSFGTPFLANPGPRSPLPSAAAAEHRRPVHLLHRRLNRLQRLSLLHRRHGRRLTWPRRPLMFPRA